MSRIEWNLISEDQSGNAKKMIDEFFESTIHSELFEKVYKNLKLLLETDPNNFYDISKLICMISNLAVSQRYFAMEKTDETQKISIDVHHLQKGQPGLTQETTDNYIIQYENIEKEFNEYEKRSKREKTEFFNRYNLSFETIPNTTKLIPYAYELMFNSDDKYLYFIINIHGSVSTIKFLDINSAPTNVLSKQTCQMKW